MFWKKIVSFLLIIGGGTLIGLAQFGIMPFLAALGGILLACGINGAYLTSISNDQISADTKQILNIVSVYRKPSEEVLQEEQLNNSRQSYNKEKIQ